MPNYAKLAKGLSSLAKGTQDVLPLAEREANLAKFLEPSAVKDRLYHGTKNDIKSFDLSKRGNSDISSVGGGVYLTPEPNVASFYSKIVPGESGANVMPVHAQIKNPFEYDLAMPFKSQKDSNEFSKKLQQAGYDSIIKRDKDGQIVELVVFEPNKIKSAIGNKGTYDVTKPDINEAKGGAIRMQAGGLSGLLNLGKAGTKLTKAEIAALRAKGMGVPNVDFADPLAMPNMRMSEALGIAGAEGKTLNFTEADRSRVFGPNRGGVGFSALQHYSEPHKKANTVWGFGNKSTAEKKINQNDPENTIWTTYAGSPEQHKSNTVVVKDAVKTLQDANAKGTVHPEQVKLINDRIRQATNKEGKLLFPSDFDITDPQAINLATTFDRRTAISDALIGTGVKKPMISKEFKATNPNVKWSDASDINRILTRETDPVLMGANTFDVGPHLFVMDNKIIHRPDLNEAFPVQVTGNDLGLRYKPVSIWNAAPEFIKEKGYGPNDPINAWAMSRGNPKQFISEEYLTNLQKAGYKDGGSVEPPPFHDFEQIINRKDGGTVTPSFTQRLQSALETHMAGGGEVSDNTTPDMTDGGNVNYGGQYAHGGGIRMNDGGSYPPKKDVPSMTPQQYLDLLALQPKLGLQSEKQIKAKLEEQYRKEKEEGFGTPEARRDRAIKTVTPALGAVADVGNLAANIPRYVTEGVSAAGNYAMSKIPSMSKPASVLDTEGTGDRVPKYPLQGLPEFDPFYGSSQMQQHAKEAGLMGESESPVYDTSMAFLSPYGAAKAPSAIKGGLNMAKPVMKEAGDIASRVAIPIQRPFTPVTFPVEGTAPDLGQGTSYGFRQGLNDVLIGEPNLGRGRNKVREGQGTYVNTSGDLELNPMLAIDVPRAGSIGNTPSANKALRQQIGQMGVDLNQEAMAGHRFLPLMTNNIKDASAMLIKTKEGLNAQEIKDLAKVLGGDMVVTHNPKLGGVVVYPFGAVEKGQIPEEFLKAQSVASELLGKRGKVQFGVSDYNKDRLFMEKVEGDYAKAGAKPMSKEQQEKRGKIQGVEKFMFPESTSGIPGQVKASPIGGLQPWSRGENYPTNVIGIGNADKTQYQPVNFLTGKQGSRYDKYSEAENARAQMLDEWHRTLPARAR